MIIRRILEKDREELRKLIAAFYVDNKKNYSPRLRDFEEYTDNNKVVEETVGKYISDQKYIIFVAEENNILIGYICGLIIQKPPHKRLNKEGYIQDWFVSIHHRKNEVGIQLLNKLLDNFKRESCTHIGLDTFAENKGAIAIYEKLGFYKRLVSFVKKI